MTRRRQCLWLGAVTGIFLASGALAASPLTAMLTRISGGVLLQQQGGESLTPAPPFKKLQSGDRLVLKAGAQVEIVHFPTAPGGKGRSEIWRGPATVSVQAGHGQAMGGEAPEARDLAKTTATVPLQAEQSPITGGFTVRGMGATAGGGKSPALEELMNVYCQLREAAASDDATPEHYLNAALTEQGYPTDPAALAGWVAEKKAQAEDGPCLPHWQKLVEKRPAK